MVIGEERMEGAIRERSRWALGAAGLELPHGEVLLQYGSGSAGHDCPWGYTATNGSPGNDLSRKSKVRLNINHGSVLRRRTTTAHLAVLRIQTIH